MADDSERSARTTYIGVYLRGICMGAADAVPGVSGGTIALLTGIYDRLIAAITAVTPTRIIDILTGVLPDRRRRAVRALYAMDAPFLAVLLAGILTAVITVTRLLDYALTTFPVVTFGSFFGLIGASALVLGRDLTLDTPGRVGAAVGGVVVAFVASGQASAALGSGPVATLIAGAIAVSAMILPGISGSLLLLVLGQYARMVDVLRRFVDAVIAVPRDGITPVVELGTTVGLFVAGAVVGLLTVAHSVRRALALRREATMAFLIGLVVGALRAPVLRTAERLPGGWTIGHLTTFVLVAIVAAIVVLGIDRVARKRGT